MENHTTTLDSSYDHNSNIHYLDYDDYVKVYLSYFCKNINNLVICWYLEGGTLLSKIVISIFFPMSLLAIYSLYSQIRSERAVPVFLINLLISDVLQVVCMVVNLAYDMDTRIKWTNFAYGMDPRTDRMYFIRTYHGFVVASALFMTLITLERYLMIAHPLWYRFNKTAKVSVSVSVATWILSILMSFVSYLFPEAGFLIPLPFMIFFVALTFRALSTAQAVPPAEKRRIVAVLVVVVLIYIVMFLPLPVVHSIIINSDCSTECERLKNAFYNSYILIQISPLADILLYIFLKKWFIDKLLTSLCCCIKDSDEAQQIVDETGSSTSKSKDHESP